MTDWTNRAVTADEAVSAVKSGMRLFDACSKAAERTQGLYGPLFGQLDPAHLARVS